VVSGSGGGGGGGGSSSTLDDRLDVAMEVHVLEGGVNLTVALLANAGDFVCVLLCSNE
jgi:hypothetical protein